MDTWAAESRLVQFKIVAPSPALREEHRKALNFSSSLDASAALPARCACPSSGSGWNLLNVGFKHGLIQLRLICSLNKTPSTPVCFNFLKTWAPVARPQALVWPYLSECARPQAQYDPETSI